MPSPGHDPEGPLTLRVAKVVDDGDPLPAPSDRPSTSSFVWSWRVGTTAAFTRVVNLDLPQLDFPAQSFVSGQTVQVRVEAHDRVARVADLLQCVQADPQPLICDAGDGCARWVTWTLGFQ